MNASGARVGLEPIERVVVMENHDAAYEVWRGARMARKTLVHIDAHHDMWWVARGRAMTIANFICGALTEDLVGEVFWVVPDQTWQTGRTRKAVRRHLRKIAAAYPGDRATVRGGQAWMSTVVLGKPLTVCALGSLPRIDDDVLLDIDVDYLVIPIVSYDEPDVHGPLPWRWPDELVRSLGARQVRSELATIAYSVEGGYTPLRWKYLGDELASRLRRPADRATDIQGFELMRAAALAAHRGGLGEAEQNYLRARDLLPDSAAPDFHLAQLCAESDRIVDGQKFYRDALARDPSYRTAYSTAGLRYFWQRRFPDAEREHRRALQLDPHDAYAHLGLGCLAAVDKRWPEAEALLRKSVALDGRLVDGYRVLGRVLLEQGRDAEAIGAYERSLKLALSGGEPIERLIASDHGERRMSDPDHCRIHAVLARLYARKGDAVRAISGYRMSIAGQHDGAVLRSRLARLYLGQRRWREGVRELGRAATLVPTDLGGLGRRVLGRAVMAWRRWDRALLSPDPPRSTPRADDGPA
jgi:tetratricopeptide (TPR) repeat protein